MPTSPDPVVRKLTAKAGGYARRGNPAGAEAARRDLAEHMAARKLAGVPRERRGAVVAAAAAMDDEDDDE